MSRPDSAHRGRRSPHAGVRPAWILLAAALAAPAPAPAQTLTEAQEAFRSGEYESAVRAYRRLAEGDDASGEARAGLVRALARLGRYEEARTAAGPARDRGPVALALGRVLEATGDLSGAEAAYRTAADRAGPWRRTASLELAEVLLATGRIREARARLDRFIDVYNDAGGGLPATDLLAVARAVRILARWDAGLFHDALRALDEAAAADPGWAEPHVELADLFLDRYDGPAAADEVDRALALDPRHPRALLLEARVREFNGAGAARERAEAALKVNPRFTDALVFLAELELTREDPAGARRFVDEALALDPGSPQALAALAAVEFFAGREEAFRRARERALEDHPGYTGVDLAVARVAERTRRYEAAAERAAAATLLDSTAWAAWGALGLNELRLGRIEEGRRHLEWAFRGDPFNPWYKNNLDLLDSFAGFRTVGTRRFELFLDSAEADLLAPLVEEVAEEAFDSLAARYGITPDAPVRVEMFPRHADFSVRTLGEVGLGALGVSFGPVVVMDSPAARRRGTYNWASTLWHELSHTFHLTLTNHRVPRWFSEGLAVHEQHRAREGWGHQPSFSFLRAFREGRLRKVSELNDGFMRPEYPEQVLHSYYQASLVFHLIEERWGFDAIRGMLEGYRDGRTTPEVMEAALHMSPRDFDDLFDDWLRERFRAPLAGVTPVAEAPPPGSGPDELEAYLTRHPGDLVARLRLGAALLAEERYDEAEPHLREVVRAFPDYGGPDSPYRLLARIHRARGETEKARAALARLNALGEANYQALREEAALTEELGRPARALAVLERTAEVDPYDASAWADVARLAASAGTPEEVVRARRAVVALHPPDLAEAYYLLALAHRDAGDTAAARRAVLRSLEVAPDYEAALDLLLALRGGPGTGRRR